MKRLILISLVAVLALALGACTYAIGQNVSGHGSVYLPVGLLLDEQGGNVFLPSEATFSLSFACYAQNNNRVEGSLKWNDPLNGVRVSATLPETPVRQMFGDYGITTCKQMKALTDIVPFPIVAITTGLYSEDGNADGNFGTQVGQVAMAVAELGEYLPTLPAPYDDYLDLIPPECDPSLNLVFVGVMSEEVPLYAAVGCLDHGRIIWGSGGQNQQ